MAPKGRSGPRSGVRKFGGQGGKGRGTKRPHKFDKGPRFDSARLADEQESEDEENESGSEPEEDVSGEEGSEDEDDKDASRPYMKLIKSFTEGSDRSNAKRRKLDHSDGPQTTSNEDKLAGDDEGGPEDVDLVEEPEEDPGEMLTEGYLDDEDDQPDTSDPFETHFANPDDASVSKNVKASEKDEWATKRFASKGLRIVGSVPKTGDEDEISLPSPISGPSALKLKRRLQESIEKKRPKFDTVEQTLAPHVFGYDDVLYCNRSAVNGESIRRLACLHAVNHVFKTRDRVIKNNAKLSHESDNEDLELRDQGFTRPKVLMLLPTRQACAKMVDLICAICEPDQQENRKRFDDSYVDKEERFSKDKPADFRDLFEGNDDDMFRLGMKFTRKSIKYFAQFYNSDIILASPLGLRMAIGSEEDKKLDYDFLSSIEVVIVDQADALLMQNWEHVEYIFEHLNLQPKDAHGCDFSRVRSWYLDGHSKYYRQTMFFSAYNSPELSEVFRLHCHNWAGKYRIHPEYPGVIQQLGVRARQTFSRFDSASIEADPDARFEYFTKAIVPTLVKRSKDSAGTLVFIPSYFDFVRVRNYFATNSSVANLTFGTISEYADVPEVSRARSHFMNGRHKVLLYTERAHHFRRYNLNGVQRVIFYGLPDNPIFYQEIAGGYLAKSEQKSTIEPGRGSVRAMFSKYDVLKLERIVGTQRVGKMIREKGDTFDFV